MTTPNDAAVDVLHRIDGLFVGLLDANELEHFNEACERGDAMRSYEGGAGFMGLARVRVSAALRRFATGGE